MDQDPQKLPAPQMQFLLFLKNEEIERIIFHKTLFFVEGESILLNLNILKTYFVN